jgi:hypothetical protein
LIKQLGVSLEPGDILGILTLDDPKRVKHAKLCDRKQARPTPRAVYIRSQ